MTVLYGNCRRCSRTVHRRAATAAERSPARPATARREAARDRPPAGHGGGVHRRRAPHRRRRLDRVPPRRDGGVDGRRAGRLVRGHRAVPASARHPDPAHRRHPGAQGPVRRRRSASSCRRTSSRADVDRRARPVAARRSNASRSGSPIPTTPSRWPRTCAEIVVGLADVVRDEDVHDVLDDEIRRAVEAHAARAARRAGARFATAEGRHQRAARRRAARRRSATSTRTASRCATGSGNESPWWLPERGRGPHLRAARSTGSAHVARERERRSATTSCACTSTSGSRDLADRLAARPELAARGEQLKHDLLAHPELRGVVASLWTELKASLRSQAADPDSALRRRLADAVVAAGDPTARRSGAPGAGSSDSSSPASATSSSTSSDEIADAGQRHDRPLGRRRDVAQASSCCSAPTCSSSASTARSSAASPASRSTRSSSCSEPACGLRPRKVGTVWGSCTDDLGRDGSLASARSAPRDDARRQRAARRRHRPGARLSMRDLVLLRHGEAEHHVRGLTGGWTDLALTAEGRRQANTAAVRLGELLADNTCAIRERPPTRGADG